MNKNVIHVTSASDMPKGPHFAILIFDTITVPAYNPNDPADYQPRVQYTAFLDEDDWKREVEYRSIGKSDVAWQAIVVKVPTIRTTVTVTVE